MGWKKSKSLEVNNETLETVMQNYATDENNNKNTINELKRALKMDDQEEEHNKNNIFGKSVCNNVIKR